MMAMAQQFAPPGAMPGHGIPHGHPLGPGHPQGGPGGQPGLNPMQMGMGGGPGGPQVGQGSMIGGGMPQMGPGGQTPMHPQLAQQIGLQNQMMNRQLMLRQNMLAAQQNPALLMSGNQGMPMMGNGMQAGPGMQRVSMPGHLQNQMPQAGHPQMHASQHQQMLVQQQQQQIQAAQQAAQQHQLQQIAMQQGTQSGPSPAQTVPNQPPMRPPSQVQNRPDQQGPAQNQNQNQSQNQNQPQPPQPQATPVQQPQPPPQQSQANQQQHLPPGNQNQSQGPQQGNQALANSQNEDGQRRAQQMLTGPQAGAPGPMIRQQPLFSPGPSTLILLQFGDFLTLPSADHPSDITYWQGVVKQFFADGGTLRSHVLHRDASKKGYEIPNATIPWYYHFLFQHGVSRIEMIVEKALERDIPGTGGHVVRSERTTFVYWYGETHQVRSIGTLQVIFDANSKIQLFEHDVRDNKEFLEREQLIPIHIAPDQKIAGDSTNSPKLSKKQQVQKGNNMAKNTKLQAALDNRPVGDYFIPDKCIQFLEMAEIFARMTPLFNHATQYDTFSATDVLKQVVAGNHQASSGQAQNIPNQPGQQQPISDGSLVPNQQGGFPPMPPNQRTPGVGPGGAFASPAPGPHLGLPGSMTASPAMMAHGLSTQGGVPMAANQSQGGGSGNPSANASPRVAGQKRRASAVKLEDEGSGPAGSGGDQKVKPSPRLNGGKRPKA